MNIKCTFSEKRLIWKYKVIPKNKKRFKINLKIKTQNRDG
jgi:hypothetical protein